MALPNRMPLRLGLLWLTLSFALIVQYYHEIIYFFPDFAYSVRRIPYPRKYAYPRLRTTDLDIYPEQEITATCELIVYKMWKPLRPTSLWPSRARYKESFTFFNRNRKFSAPPTSNQHRVILIHYSIAI
jgi:hypothetical protein